MDKKQLILDLHRIGAVKFGQFILKSGMSSPIYIDLRVTVSYPEVLEKIALTMMEKMKDLKCDIIAGIPYTALPIATVISIKTKTPMIYARKETKEYGTKKQIEGVFKKGDKCLIVDDLITTGESKFETAKPFQKIGLIIKDFIVLVDREQGGKEQLQTKGYNLYSIITISELLDVLKKEGKITQEQFLKTKKFIEENKI